jgi:hypothetical protein
MIGQPLNHVVNIIFGEMAVDGKTHAALAPGGGREAGGIDMEAILKHPPYHVQKDPGNPNRDEE